MLGLKSNKRRFRLSSLLGGRVRRLPIAHLHKQMPAIISKLERHSGLLVERISDLGMPMSLRPRQVGRAASQGFCLHGIASYVCTSLKKTFA
jgi:hypothetical protein